jgi:hypothetical protein
MFHQRASVMIATLQRDKANHSLARWVILTNTVLEKTSLKKYSSVTKTYTIQNSIGKNKHTLVSKNTPQSQKKGRDVFSTPKVGFDLVLVSKITFCWDILFGTLLSCFLTPVKR